MLTMMMRALCVLFAFVVCTFAQTCSVPVAKDAVNLDASKSGDVATLYNIASAQECCSACATFQECVHYSWVASSKQCFIKNKNVRFVDSTTTQSGTIARPLPSRSGSCTGTLTNTDYNNGALTNAPAADLNACCAMCRNYTTCNYYTYVPINKQCYLKGSNGNKVANSGTTVGSVVTPRSVPLRTGKRGIAWFNSFSCSDLQKMTNVAWIYNWAAQPPAAILQCINDLGMEYIPMQWGLPLALQHIYTDSKYLLTYNEPNFREQGNILPVDAATSWPAIESFAAQYNMQISSPASAAGGFIDPIHWLDQFFGNCTLKYGAKGCKVDFITTHIYTCSAPGVNGFLGQFKKYNKPIWLTEFACPTVNPAVTIQASADFVTQTLAYLENDPAYARYAYFGTRIEPTDGWLGPRINLFDNTKSALTPVGVAYTTAPTKTPTATTAPTPAPTTPATPAPTKAATPAPTTPVTPGPTGAATPAPTKAATPAPTSAPPAGGYLGCYVDNTAARDLSTTGPNSASNTVEKCRYWCGLRQFSYSGLQWGQECFCGNRFGSLGVAAASDCNMPCTGNSAQICGAGSRNSVWNSADVGYLGCYADGDNPRDFTVKLSWTPTMTIDTCRQSCKANNYAYAGLQYANECWCGNSVGRYGKVADAECNMACQGDPTQRCGAGMRNSVFTSMAASSYPGY